MAEDILKEWKKLHAEKPGVLDLVSRAIEYAGGGYLEKCSDVVSDDGRIQSAFENKLIRVLFVIEGNSLFPDGQFWGSGPTDLSKIASYLKDADEAFVSIVVTDIGEMYYKVIEENKIEIDMTDKEGN